MTSDNLIHAWLESLQAIPSSPYIDYIRVDSQILNTPINKIGLVFDILLEYLNTPDCYALSCPAQIPSTAHLLGTITHDSRYAHATCRTCLACSGKEQI